MGKINKFRKPILLKRKLNESKNMKVKLKRRQSNWKTFLTGGFLWLGVVLCGSESFAGAEANVPRLTAAEKIFFEEMLSKKMLSKEKEAESLKFIREIPSKTDEYILEWYASFYVNTLFQALLARNKVGIAALKSRRPDTSLIENDLEVKRDEYSEFATYILYGLETGNDVYLSDDMDQMAALDGIVRFLETRNQNSQDAVNAKIVKLIRKLANSMVPLHKKIIYSVGGGAATYFAELGTESAKDAIKKAVFAFGPFGFVARVASETIYDAILYAAGFGIACIAENLACGGSWSNALVLNLLKGAGKGAIIGAIRGSMGSIPGGALTEKFVSAVVSGGAKLIGDVWSFRDREKRKRTYARNAIEIAGSVGIADALRFLGSCCKSVGERWLGEVSGDTKLGSAMKRIIGSLSSSCDITGDFAAEIARKYMRRGRLDFCRRVQK
jgi:hypothetical protein